MANRAARTVFWIAALVVVCVIGAWALLPWFVSSDVVRSAIERELGDIAGQPVIVEGRVDIDLFPAPIARLQNLHVPRGLRPDGSRGDDVLVVDMVEVAIPFSSLVRRDPEFSDFRLIRPVIRVDARNDGSTALTRPGGRLATALAEYRRLVAESDNGEVAGLPAAGLGTFTIENGTVEFIDANTDTSEKITALNGTVAWPRFDGRMSASLGGIWRGAAFQQTADIDQAIRFFADQITPVRTGFTSDVLSYSFDGRAGFGDVPYAEGAVSFQTPSLRQALEWLQAGIEPGRAIGEISVEGTVRGDSKRFRFDNLNMVLQGSSGSGVMEFAFGEGANPSLTATLDFVELDILSYLSAFTGFPETANEIDDVVSTAFIDQMDVDLRLSAARASAGPISFVQVAAVTQIRNGEAVFEMADATGYGGNVQARFKIGRYDTRLEAELGVSADRVDTAALTAALGINGLFPIGNARLSLKVKSPVQMWSDLFRRAAGTIELQMAGGAIAGFSRQALLGNGGEQRFFRLQDVGTADQFDSLNLAAQVQDGVIIIDDAMIEYPDTSVRLNGVIPYGTASVALTTIASDRASGEEANRPVVQHFIGGSWSNPYATPVLLPGMRDGIQ
jgi:AsmA protein